MSRVASAERPHRLRCANVAAACARQSTFQPLSDTPASDRGQGHDDYYGWQGGRTGVTGETVVFMRRSRPAGGNLVFSSATGEEDEVLMELEPDVVVAVEPG